MNNKLLIFAAVALAFAACSQIENPEESNVPVNLSYSTVSAIETKAAQNLNNDYFASGESVTVRISNTGAGEWTNYTFTTGAAGVMNAPDPAPYYPAGSQNIDIAAYYPASAGTSFSVAADQTSDADYKDSDLMFALVEDQAKQDAAVNLAFSHKMAKLNVNITAGSGVSSISSVNILNVKPTVSFNQATGEVGEATGSATSIAMSNNGAAVIPAQTISGGLLSIVTDKGTATYSVSDKVFEAGKLYTINITVNLRAVGTTTAITGWTSEGTVTVTPVSRIPGSIEAVDLGLSVKWANMNVGAEAETDYGTYFAWGETLGYTVIGSSFYDPAEGNVKTSFERGNYSLINDGDSPKLIKYNFKESQGYVDNRETLDVTDDAACANWGGSWRMPTKAECEELINTFSDTENYTWTFCDGSTTQYKGSTVKGIIVQSKKAGSAGNCIFLPFAGNRQNDAFYGMAAASFWSSTVLSGSESTSHPYSANAFCCASNDNPYILYMNRYYGLPVRAVQP